LDLTDANVLGKLGFGLDELMEEDWHAIQSGGQESWTQAIARGCRSVGFEGLIAQSARDRRGRNVVIFPDKLRKGSSIELVTKEDLPPHPSGWPK